QVEDLVERARRVDARQQIAHAFGDAAATLVLAHALLDLREQPRILDRQRRLLGKCAREVNLLRRKLARLGVVQRDRTEDATASDQRRRRHGAKASHQPPHTWSWLATLEVRIGLGPHAQDAREASIVLHLGLAGALELLAEGRCQILANQRAALLHSQTGGG